MFLLGFLIGIIGSLIAVFGIICGGAIFVEYSEEKWPTAAQGATFGVVLFGGGALVFGGVTLFGTLGYMISMMEVPSDIDYLLTIAISVVILIGLCTGFYFLGRERNVDARSLIFLGRKK